MENNYEKILEKLKVKIIKLILSLKLWLDSGKPVNKIKIMNDIKISHDVLEKIDSILHFMEMYNLD